MRHYLILLSILGLNSFSLLHITAHAGALEQYRLPSHIKKELKQIQGVIEKYVGSKVYWDDNHQLCRQGILGAYIPSYDIMINCVGNHGRDYLELLMTAKHEGWHAVQYKCNDNRAALRDDQIRPHLLKPVKDILRHSYHPKDFRSEAEARVVEQIPTPNWIKGVKSYCAHRVK